MTFSIIASNEGNLGIGVVSGSASVGRRVPWVKEKVGAIATQGYTEITYGKRGLTLLEKGLIPDEVLENIARKDPEPEKRQVGILNSSGEIASKTGSLCPGKKNSETGDGYISMGNMLRNEETVPKMMEVFEEGGIFSQRILNALEAGARSGGDRRGNRTAALVVRGGENLNIEIDLSESPVEELREKYEERTR